MNRNIFLILTTLLVASILVTACGPAPTPETITVKETVVVPPTPVPAVAAQEGKLVSTPVDAAPVVDVNANDVAWAMAPESVLKVQASGIPGYDLKMKSVYTSDTVYFLLQYPDANMEAVRAAWVYDPKIKTWNHLSDDFGDEDEFGLWWNMTVPDFATTGCMGACHGDKMYTNAPDQNADMWTWQSVRVNPMGWGRDFLVTNDPTADDAGGFVKDEGVATNKGYGNNDQDLNGVTVPAYWKPFTAGGISTGDPRYLLQSEIDAGIAKKIVKFDKATGQLTDETGAVVPSWVQVPGYILSKPAGPSWNDITAKGTWDNGVWTVEMSRKLGTGHKDDIQFIDLTATYYFDGYIKTRQTGAGDPHDNIPTTPFVFAPK